MNKTMPVPLQSSDAPCEASIVQKVALTSGQWSVSGSGLWADEPRGLVYFTGFRDSPLEQHLYVVSVGAPGVCQRLTEPGFTHAPHVNAKAGLFVTTYSSIEAPPQVSRDGKMSPRLP